MKEGGQATGGSANLEELCKFYEITHPGPHAAFFDVIVTALLYCKLFSKEDK